MNLFLFLGTCSGPVSPFLDSLRPMDIGSFIDNITNFLSLEHGSSLEHEVEVTQKEIRDLYWKIR